MGIPYSRIISSQNSDPAAIQKIHRIIYHIFDIYNLIKYNDNINIYKKYLNFIQDLDHENNQTQNKEEEETKDRLVYLNKLRNGHGSSQADQTALLSDCIIM